MKRSLQQAFGPQEASSRPAVARSFRTLEAACRYLQIYYRSDKEDCDWILPVCKQDSYPGLHPRIEEALWHLSSSHSIAPAITEALVHPSIEIILLDRLSQLNEIGRGGDIPRLHWVGDVELSGNINNNEDGETIGANTWTIGHAEINSQTRTYLTVLEAKSFDQYPLALAQLPVYLHAVQESRQKADDTTVYGVVTDKTHWCFLCLKTCDSNCHHNCASRSSRNRPLHLLRSADLRWSLHKTEILRWIDFILGSAQDAAAAAAEEEMQSQILTQIQTDLRESLPPSPSPLLAAGRREEEEEETIGCRCCSSGSKSEWETDVDVHVGVNYDDVEW
ncbi:hypothetical protein VTN77DRAFT_2607 [Rasamsonia byssochlamydoides]|uniref:uncharacterized protein n=1 Tax=Rasamsonia byssochlamydoides TaxID=89139 RepID=UPI003742ED0B